MREFNAYVAEERPDRLADGLVARVATLMDAELAVLTVVETRTGRHHVRAVHGTDSASLGVEVLPGVGITGRALRDQRTVIVGPPAGAKSAVRLLAKVRQRFGAAALATARTSAMAPAMALPAIHAGSVVGTLTVGRKPGRPPFSGDEREMLELVTPLVALALANGILRNQLREASLLDPVTGLFNRSYLDAALAQLVARRRRTPPEKRTPVSMVLFDIDGFGRLNETHGQLVGDRVLRAVGTLLRQRFRASDTIARVGGDGFFVILEGAEPGAALDVAGQVRAQVRALSLSDERGARLSISISAGVARYNDEALRPDAIIRTVEAALDTARWSSPGAIVAI